VKPRGLRSLWPSRLPAQKIATTRTMWALGTAPWTVVRCRAARGRRLFEAALPCCAEVHQSARLGIQRALMLARRFPGFIVPTRNAQRIRPIGCSTSTSAAANSTWHWFEKSLYSNAIAAGLVLAGWQGPTREWLRLESEARMVGRRNSISKILKFCPTVPVRFTWRAKIKSRFDQ